MTSIGSHYRHSPSLFDDGLTFDVRRNLSSGENLLVTATPSSGTWIVTGIDTRERGLALMSRPDKQDETANPAACTGTNDSGELSGGVLDSWGS